MRDFGFFYPLRKVGHFIQIVLKTAYGSQIGKSMK